MSSWRNVIEAIAGSSCPRVLIHQQRVWVRTRSRFPFEDLALATDFWDLAHHPKGPTVSPAPPPGDEMFKYLSLSETFPIQTIMCANVIAPWIPEAKGIFPLFYCRFAQLLLPWPPTSRDHRKWMVDLFCFGFSFRYRNQEHTQLVYRHTLNSPWWKAKKNSREMKILVSYT